MALSKRRRDNMSKGQINILSRCIRLDEQNQNMLDIVGGDTWQKSWPDKPFIFGGQILIAATVTYNYCGDGKVEWAPITVSGSRNTSCFLCASTCEQPGLEIVRRTSEHQRSSENAVLCLKDTGQISQVLEFSQEELTIKYNLWKHYWWEKVLASGNIHRKTYPVKEMLSSNYEHLFIGCGI